MPDTFAQAALIIYRSDDDGQTWQPVLPADVPEWVKAPDNVAMMINGHMCKQRTEILTGRDVKPWFRAERLDPAQNDATVQ